MSDRLTNGSVIVVDGEEKTIARDDGEVHNLRIRGEEVELGDGATAAARAVAVGNRADATGGSTAIAIGEDATADENATAVGRNTDAAGGGVAIGINASNDLESKRPIAIGRGAAATHDETVAIGTDATAAGRNGIGIGLNASGDGSESVALGPGASVTGSRSIALGSGAEVVDNGVMVVRLDDSNVFRMDDQGNLEITGGLTENATL